MFEALCQALAAGLKLWDHKDANSYNDQMLQIRKDWYAEYNKGHGVRDNAFLDNLELELRQLAIAFSARIEAEKAGN